MKMLTGVLTLMLWAVANEAAGEVRNWTKFVEDDGLAFECQVVRTRRTLINVLKDAGWDTSDWFPRVDWRSEVVVVVAPAGYYENGYLAFRELTWEGGEIILNYEWRRIQGIQRQTDGVILSGMVVGAGREALVVALPRSRIAEAFGGCRNLEWSGE